VWWGEFILFQKIIFIFSPPKNSFPHRPQIITSSETKKWSTYLFKEINDIRKRGFGIKKTGGMRREHVMVYS
jgi:hypothetical protein